MTDQPAPTDPEPTAAGDRPTVAGALRSYAHHLVAFAIGSPLIAAGFAAIGPKYGAALLTPVWVIFIVLVSLNAARLQGSVRGIMRLHALTVGSWVVLWMVVLFASIPLHQARWWWVAGGIALAVPPVVARLRVDRLTPRPERGAVTS